MPCGGSLQVCPWTSNVPKSSFILSHWQITILETNVVSISLNFILIRMDLDPSSTLVQILELFATCDKEHE